ncbi:MAG: universal stress protein [Deltaproteobacteria bacterium]|nr:universal stress protein [Deltaproteobacteria bacterium]
MATHPTVKTILVATDFSEDAGAALDWAAAVARESGAKIILTHAAMVTTPVAPEFVPLDGSFYTQLYDIARSRLEELAVKVREDGLTVETELSVEPAVSSVLSVAQKRGADVIVAGTRGLTGWKRVVLGSVAARIVREARCPVVTVHAADAKKHRPVRTILIATDFSEDAALAASAASRLVGEGGPDRRLVLLHVYHYPVIFTQSAPPVLAAKIEEVIHSARREIAALAARFERQGVHVETRIDEGTPARVILDHAEQLGADLIAMGTHGRSGLDRLFLGSTASKVLSAAPCPVLTVRSPV